MMSIARFACAIQPDAGEASGLTAAPALETRTLRYAFHTVSRPRLSYTPPSARLMSFSSASVSAYLLENWDGSTRRTKGESTGGNAEEAATALASGSVGLSISPTL